MAQPRRQLDRIDLSAGAEKLSLFAGLTAGLAYSTFRQLRRKRAHSRHGTSSSKRIPFCASRRATTWKSSTSMAPFRQFLRR